MCATSILAGLSRQSSIETAEAWPDAGAGFDPHRDWRPLAEPMTSAEKGRPRRTAASH